MAERLDDIYALLVTIQLNMQENFTFLNKKIDAVETRLDAKIESVRKELKQDIRNAKYTLRKETKKNRTDLVDFIEECDNVINQRTIDNKKRIIRIESYFPQETTSTKE